MKDPIQAWIRWLDVERGTAPSTRKLYQRTLESLRDDLGDPSVLDESALRAWIYSKGGSVGTISNRISHLKSFYYFLVRSRVRHDDPARTLKSPTKEDRPREPVENLEEVLDGLDDVDRKANHWSSEERRVGESRDMAVLLVETGLRIHEAVRCDWPVPCPAEVTIKGRGRKERSLELSDAAREAWNRLGGKWPIGARATQRRFEKVGLNPERLRYSTKTAAAESPRPSGSSKEVVRHDISSAVERVLSNYSDDELETVHSFLTDMLAARHQ